MGNQINGVAFATTQIGWAVSGGGVILHTSDGGLSWAAQNSNTLFDLNAVTCASTTVAWAVGTGGTVVHTTDGGAHWSGQSSDTGVPLYAVACSGATNAWAVGSGGVITHTSDGATWATQTSNTGANLHGVACSGALDAWAVGDGGVITHTSDGGTWATQASSTVATLHGVACSGALSAWAVGDGGAVERTSDGGGTWADVASGASNTNLLGVAAANASCVWAVGTSGVVLCSTDGGQTWPKQTSGTTDHLRAVACSGTTHAWAVGDIGTVIMSTDGLTWTSAPSGVASGVAAVALMGGVPLAVGPNGVLSWDPISKQWLSVASTTSYGLGAVATSPVDSQDACAVGGGGTILVTTDGGTTWTNKHMYQINANLNGVSYGARYVVAVGQSGQTCLSGDSGNGWFPESDGHDIGDLHAVTTYSLGSTNYAVAVGSGGLIELSTDGGSNWALEAATPPVYKDLYGVTSVVTGTNVDLWAVGTGGTILHSGDGQIWTVETSHTTASLVGVNAQGSRILAVGGAGTIDYSADGGSTWTPEDSGAGAFLTGAVVGPLGADWVVGTDGNVGAILYTNTDGVGAPPDTQPPSAVTGLTSSTHPDPALWYVSNTPAFSWNAATDPTPGFGLKDYVYLLDQNAGTTIDVTTAFTHATGQTTVTLPSTPDGVWYFHVCARDNAGNYGPTATRAVQIDATAPVTTAVGVPATWQNAAVEVTLQATDTASRVAGSWWELDQPPLGLPPSDWTAGLGPINIAGDGSHTLYFYSTDNCGNQETPESAVVRIDTIAPTTTPATLAPAPNAAWWNSSDVTVTLHADDGSGSGIAKTQYAPHGSGAWADAAGNQFVVAGPANHANDGVHVYDYRALDNAGNISGLGTLTVRIDTTPPTMSASGVSGGAWLNHAATVVLRAADDSAGSSVAAITYTLDGAAQTVAATSASVLLPAVPNATHTLTYRASDLAGNSSATQTLILHIDTIGPTTAGKAAKGRKGKPITLKYRVSDNLSPQATAVTLVVKNARHKVAKTFKLGTKQTATWYALKWTPKAKGTYSYSVSARDLAGNTQVKAGSAKIKVK